MTKEHIIIIARRQHNKYCEIKKKLTKLFKQQIVNLFSNNY